MNVRYTHTRLSQRTKYESMKPVNYLTLSRLQGEVKNDLKPKPLLHRILNTYKDEERQGKI